MINVLLIVLAAAFPSSSPTAWMSPAAFRIQIGMTEHEVRQRFAAASLELVAGEIPGQFECDYEDGKMITVQFSDGRLVSMRFELVDFLTVIDDHWGDLRTRLRRNLGKPTLALSDDKVLIWQESEPQVMAALSIRTDDRFGKQGLGFAVVRYFEAPPADAAITFPASDGR